MVKWKEEMVIDENIEKVWALFQDRNIKTIMPKVEEHILLEGEDDSKGAIHSQSYYEGTQMASYLVETLSYEAKPERKYRSTTFVMGQMFKVNYAFTLEKIAEGKTKFVYEGSNKGVNLTGKAMLLTGSKQKREATVRNFMERVNTEAIK